MITKLTSFQQKEFSCSIPDIGFSILGDRAGVKVVLTKSGSGKTVYDELLYPDEGGAVALTDVDRLVEPYARKWLVFTLTVTISEQSVSTNATTGEETVTVMDTKTLSTTVVSCRANILNTTAADFCRDHFLSLIGGAKQTASGFLEYLSYIGSDTCRCTAWYDDGSSRGFNVSSLNPGSDYTLVNVSPDNFITSGRTLVRYLISAGSREQEFELMNDCEPDIAPVLLFMNSFGVQELAYCTGEHKMVSSFDRKQTRIGRLKTSYQVDDKVTFKADTGYLSFPMAEWWRDVLRSKDIRVLPVQNGGVLVGEGLPVVISSEKVELSNAPDALPRYTFEYEYADRNHNVWDLRREGRIFDNTFDYTFN